MQLVRPTLQYLASYADALRRGWSPDNMRMAEATAEELERIARDPVAFVEQQTDLEAKRGPITLPDGSRVPCLPGFHLWMWDGDFCGSIGLRWQPGSTALPPHCLGHIGYAVVPWKERRGYATQALRQMLPLAKEQGLGHVDITTNPDNVGSQRVILANCGVLQKRFRRPEQFGATEALLYRIFL